MPSGTRALTARWARRVRRLLLPDVCLLCSAPAGRLPNLCDPCTRDLIPLTYPPAPSPQTRFRVACSYAPPVSTLVQALKFRSDLAAGLTLGTLLAQHLVECPMPLPQALIPVPLHPARLRQRGFNQAVEIARVVAGWLDISLEPNACRRIRATLPQSDLSSARERRNNVSGAFAVHRGLHGLDHVALVDDVVTTGTTSRELVRILRRAGVRRVDVWACARPVRSVPGGRGPV